MSNAVLTGTVDLASLETGSTESHPKFTHRVEGNMLLNGVRVPLHSHTQDNLVKTINRFTPQTTVTASAASSAGAKVKYLTLTSPEDMRVDGDQGLLFTLGLVSGTVLASTGATAVSTTAAST